MRVLTVEVRSEDKRAASVLCTLFDAGKLPLFGDAIVNKRDAWTTFCRLEDDLLAFASRNRWCAALEDWKLVLGHCPYMDDVPEYTGYGHMQAWLEYGDRWAVTIQQMDLRQREDQPDVIVWDTEEFEDHTGASRYVAVAFADDSAIHLNRAVRELRGLEQAWLVAS